MGTLKLNCKPIDDLIGDGLESGIITKIYGDAGTGKTNICLQASRECSSEKKKVAFIDTEGVSIERLRQICTNKYNYKLILENILFFSPNSFEKQENMILEAIELEKLGLIIVDTITFFYRVNLEDDKESAMRSFTRQFANLQISSRKNDIPILVAEQVYTDKNGDVKPFTNRDTEHMAKTILKLEKIGTGKRQATIIKHRSQPEEKKAIFSIKESGLE